VTFIPIKKGTLLVPSSKGDYHLFVILTDKCKDGYYLAANISSVEEELQHDTTCEVVAGEHRFVDRLSFVMYGLAEMLHHAVIIARVDRGIWKPKEPVSDALHKRICDGILISPHTKPPIKNYYRQIMGLVVVEKKRKIKRINPT
jgi:hypothetical protein